MTTFIYEGKEQREDSIYRYGNPLIYVTESVGGVQVQIWRERQGGLTGNFVIVSDEFIPDKFIPLLKLGELRLVKTLLDAPLRGKQL